MLSHESSKTLRKKEGTSGKNSMSLKQTVRTKMSKTYIEA
jgi:hypothetical protein